MLTNEQIDRYWKKVNKSDSCWEWTASKDRDGYGIFCVTAPKTMKAHRISAELAGKDITQVVRHTCHNPACVNPDHLVSGTQTDNMKDMYQAGRARIGYGGRKKIAVRTPAGDFDSIGAAAKACNIDTTTVRKRIINETLGWSRL